MSANGSGDCGRGSSSYSRSKIWTGSLILKKVNRPDLENLRHRDNSLKLWIFEAKRLPSKKRYFCEICLDHILYARTTTKEKTADADPFWGEPFEFSNLQDIALVTVKLFREADRKKKKDKNQLIGEVRLGVHDIGSAVEQWYALDPSTQTPASKQQPSTVGANGGGSGGVSKPDQACIRLRSHYISIDVLPLQCYRGLHEFLMLRSDALVAALEPRLALRDKEEMAARLISVAHARASAEPLLTDLVMQELAASANDLLVFRGNSIATKAVEFYLRLTGSEYLRQVMSEPLSILLKADPACEVDPQRVDSAETLANNQRCLREYVDLFWERIQQSVSLIPQEIGRLFALIRQQLAETRRQELGDTLVSASLFLRLVCPAILGPSLFGLTQELPSQQSARALTLIAKTIQNLANGTLYGAKEAYMQFMNRFLEERSTEMRLFLKAASRCSQQPSVAASAACIDLGCELAQLHLLLCTTCQGQQQQNQQTQHPDWQRHEACIAELSGHLTALTHCLRHGGYAGPVLPPPQPTHLQMAAATIGSAASDDDWVYSNVAESSPPPQPPVATVPARQISPQQQLLLLIPPPQHPLPQPTQSLPQQPLQQQHRLASSTGRQRQNNQNCQYQQQQQQPPQHSYPPQQMQQSHSQNVHEDWKKVLEEAHIFAATTSGSGGCVGAGGGAVGGGGGSSGGGAASTTGSSGYQSFAATSPVQFFNPTYQKGGLPPLLRSNPAAAAGPPATVGGFADDDDDVGGNDYEDEDEDLVDSPRRDGGSSSSEMASSEASSVGPAAPTVGSARRPIAEVGLQIRGWDSAESARFKSRSLGPAFASSPSTTGDPLQRVRMGVRATQQPQPQPQPQPQSHSQVLANSQRSQVDYETELQKLQRELMETKHKLHATEARLRNNEQEKVQLVAQFEHQHQHQHQHQQQQHQQQQQQHQQQQPTTSDSAQQLQEILQRLQSLETSFRQSGATTTGSGKRQDLLDSI